MYVYTIGFEYKYLSTIRGCDEWQRTWNLAEFRRVAPMQYRGM